MNRPWLRDLVLLPTPPPPPLSREDFVAQYFPKYVQPYQPPRGIRMVRGKRGDLHVQMSTKASTQAQVTTRERRIDEGFADYLALYAEVAKDSRQAPVENPTP